jgi:hypothetical protein
MRVGIRIAVVAAAASSVLLLGSPTALGTPGSLEFGKCEKVAEGTGAFGNSKCTKPGKTKKFEWVPLPEPVGITISKTGKTPNLLLEGEGGIEMQCTGEMSASGSATAGGLTNVVLRATGCKAGGFNCQSNGQAEGTVLTLPLAAVPGITQRNGEGKEEADIVGLAFAGEGTEVANWRCGPGPLMLSGSVISGFPVNKPAAALKYAYVQEHGKQVPEAFVEGPAQFLEWTVFGGPVERAGVSLAATLKTVSKAKIELRHCEANVC